jgi:hypothetical protein
MSAIANVSIPTDEEGTAFVSTSRFSHSTVCLAVISGALTDFPAKRT